MPIRFQCDECDTRIRVPDGSEGKRVRCPKCGNRQRVPGGKKAKPVVKEVVNDSSEVLDPPQSPHEHTPDEIQLSSDPINRPSRSKSKRKKHYIPKALKEQAPEDAVPVGLSSERSDSSSNDEAADSSTFKETESKPAGESMADQGVESDDVADAAQQPDQPQPYDGDQPLLTLDQQPEGMMDSDDLEVPAAISSSDSIDQDEQPQPNISQAFDQSDQPDDDQPVTQQTPAVETKPAQPVAKAIPLSQGPPADVEDEDDGDGDDGEDDLDDSLGGSSLDDSAIDDLPDFDEKPIDPEDIDDSDTIDDSGFLDSVDQDSDDLDESEPPAPAPPKQTDKKPAPKKPTAKLVPIPEPVPASAPVASPKSAVNAPSFVLLLLIAWMMRTFSLLMIVGVCVLSLTEVMDLGEIQTNGRIAIIVAGVGVALLFWGLGEAFSAIRDIARNSFRSQ